jgi:hypothetical protein
MLETAVSIYLGLVYVLNELSNEGYVAAGRKIRG